MDSDPAVSSVAALSDAAMASCPVTAPNWEEVPWGYQNASGTLSTALWPDGRVVFERAGPIQPAEDGTFRMKWPWWRLVEGDVVIQGRRLDAEAPAMPAIVLRGPADGYGETGFHPSGLIFPTVGCWEVTAQVAEASLTFVTLIILEE